MARYYFHVRDKEELIRDYEGNDSPDLTAAVQEAESAARELIIEAIKAGEPANHRTIEITDENDRIVATVPVSKVLKVNSD